MVQLGANVMNRIVPLFGQFLTNFALLPVSCRCGSFIEMFILCFRSDDCSLE